MNFLIFDDKTDKPKRNALPISFFEPDSKSSKSSKSKKDVKVDKPKVKDEEASGVHAFIASNPSKKDVAEYFKSRIEELCD